MWFQYTDYSSEPYLCIMLSQIISSECGSSLSVPNEYVDKFPKTILHRFYISHDFVSVLVTEICVEVNESFSIYFGKGLPR